MDAVGTIGSKPCEVVLNKILDERKDPKLTNKVMSRLLGVKHNIKQLKQFVLTKDPPLFFTLLVLLRDETYKVLDKQRYSLPDEVYTHLRCCLAAYYSEAFKEYRDNR